MPDLKLFLLGPPHLELDGAPVEIRRRKVLALLSYLALSGQPHTRDALATLFWPEHDQRRARAYLRRDLAILNTSLPGDWLIADRETVELRQDANFWVDVVHFHQLLAACQGHDHPPEAVCAACLPLLTEAVACYADDFLAGFTLRDCPEFDDWQFFQAESLRQELASALERLVHLLSAQGEYAAAIPYTRRRLALDPLHEPAQRQLLHLYDHTGQPVAALRQYEEYVVRLEEELGVPPEEETITLYEAIKAKRILRPFIKAEEQRSRGAREQDNQPSSSPAPLFPGSFASVKRSTPHHNLPAQLTPFIGREQELAEIKRLLLDKPACRLLTLVGPGGIGKTRLALEAASLALATFSNGVYFVSLASVSEAEVIVSAIAKALNFTFSGATGPKTQLLNYLREKKLLLVADNFEHLLGGAKLLADILSAAPEVKLLVTSRERLNLREEWGYEVQGMDFPRAQERILAEGPQALEAYSAVRLFLQRARRAKASFSLSVEDIPYVVRICQLVGGMPLGLELAAAWVRSMSCQEIAHEIERNFDLLTSSVRNMPERHRSLRAVFEQTWERLPDTERDVLRRLSVFRGGCPREAAEAVAGAPLPLLASLVDKALLRRTRDSRYEMHELIRQFAAEQLQSRPEDNEQIQGRHCTYYAVFLQERTKDIKGGREKKALDEIASDIDNIRAAWQWAVTHRDAQAIEQSTECLWEFYEIRGALYEGEAAFREAVAAFATAIDQPADIAFTEKIATTVGHETLVGFLLSGQGWLCSRRGGLAEGRALMERGISLMRQARHRDSYKEATSLMYLGFANINHGQYTEANQLGQESLALFTEIGDHWSLAECFMLLGASAQLEGRLAEAEKHLQACLSICREIGNLTIKVYANYNLINISLMLGAYAQAKQLLDENAKISQEFDNLIVMAGTLNKRGRLAVAQGECAQAVETVQESLAIYKEIGRGDVSAGLIDLGAALRLQGDYAGADRAYQASLAIAKAVGHQPEIAACLSGMGCLAYDRGEYQAAEQLQQEALAIWQNVNNEPEIASILRYLGHIIAASGETREREARQYYQQTLQLAAKHRLAPVALDVFVGLTRLLIPANATEKAVELLALADHHPASTYETKANARKRLTELAAELPAELVRSAQARGQIRAWEATAAELVEIIPSLDNLTGGETSSPVLPDSCLLLSEGQRYVQEALIASGGMGEVYQGRDTETGQQIAIKRLKPDLVAHNPEAVKRLIREGDILRHLNHPNIVKILTTLQAEGHPLIIMEYVPGGSLRDLLEHQPQLPLDRVLTISLELADALARAHHLGIIHRDLKPANVLLAEDGTPRLTDFGVAYLAQQETRLTQEGAILGTSVYMSPEAWRGEALDARSDIWSFGALLYEMLAGRPPFAAQQIAAVVTAILHDPVPELAQFRPDVPPVLVALIKQMLTKERELRIDSMRQVAAGLEVIRRGVAAWDEET